LLKNRKKTKNKETKKQLSAALDIFALNHIPIGSGTALEQRHFIIKGVGMVEPGGFEPPTPGLQSRCSPG
jgi:hypothetical protein